MRYMNETVSIEKKIILKDLHENVFLDLLCGRFKYINFLY